MKKTFFLLLILGLASVAYSQPSEVRLNAYGNYAFDDPVDNYYSSTSYFNGTIKGGFLWGGGLEFRLHDYYGLELLYQRLDTHAPMQYYDYNANAVKNTNFKLGLNYSNYSA